METNASGNIVSAIGRNWMWALIALVVAVLALAVVAEFGAGSAQAASSVPAVSAQDEPVANFDCGPLKGDVNTDCFVNLSDVFMLLSHMGHSGYPLCDLDNNGSIWISDLYALIQLFGSTST
jgi:hypothetical protein